MSDLPIIDSCEGCGVCCLEQQSPPGYLAILVCIERGLSLDGTPQDDVRRFKELPTPLATELRVYLDMIRDGAPHPDNDICLWFNEDTRQCDHYDLRPSLCREFEVAGKACRMWRDKYDVI